jgi:hypothetical protein
MRPRNPAIQREVPKAHQQQPQQHAQHFKLQRTHAQPPPPHQQQQQQQQGYCLPPSVPYMPGPLMIYPSMGPWQTWGGRLPGSMPVSIPGASGAWHAQQQQLRDPLLPQPQHMHGSQMSHTLPSISRHSQQQQQQQQQQHHHQMGGYAAAAGGAANYAQNAGRTAGNKVAGKGGSYAQQLKAAGQRGGSSSSFAAAASTASKQPRYAAAAKSSPASLGATRSAGSKQAQMPDRFKEAGKNVAMISAIASRW